MKEIHNNLTPKELEVLEKLGEVNYSLYNISIYMEIPLKLLEIWMRDETSPAYQAYHRGKLKNQFEIEYKLTQDAKTGNLTAIQILDKHKRKNELEEVKNLILYG